MSADDYDYCFVDSGSYKGLLVDWDELMWDIQHLEKKDYDSVVLYLKAVKVKREAQRGQLGTIQPLA